MAIDRHDQQERNTDCREMTMAAGIVQAIGIDHRRGSRQSGLRLVMIDNNDIQPCVFCRRKRLKSRDAAIDRDHQLSALLAQTQQSAGALGP